MSVKPPPQPAAPPRSAPADLGRSPLVRRTAQNVRRNAAVPVSRAHPSPVQPGAGHKRDVLLDEKAKGRITEAEYLAGRMLQVAFECGSGARLGSADLGGVRATRGSALHDLAMILRIEDADRMRKFTARLQRTVGHAGVKFLRAILVGGHDFTSYAASEGRSGNSGTLCIGDRFRWFLSELVEAQHTAVGPNRLPIRAEACSTSLTSP